MSNDLSPSAPSSSWRRWLAPVAILILMGLAFSMGWHRYLTLESLAENRATLRAYTEQNFVFALLTYAAIYVVAVALSVPGAVILTIAGGFLFGWLVGGFTSVVAATLGAMLVFQIAKSSLGESMARKAGPALSRLKDGFAADAFNYLLFLRLVPAFPFWLVNIAPALANVPLRTFALATALGIVPGTFAFSFVGSGLDSVLDAQAAEQALCAAEKDQDLCPFNLSPSALITTELLLAFAALGLVALIPIAIKKWKSA